MRYDREAFNKRQTEFYSVFAVVIGELTRTLGGQVWRLQALSTGTTFDSIHPAANFMLDHTGDFSATYVGSYVIQSLIPRGSDKFKQNVASAISMTAAVAAETIPLLGEPRLMDLPAAVIGIAAYRGLHWYINRK